MNFILAVDQNGVSLYGDDDRPLPVTSVESFRATLKNNRPCSVLTASSFDFPKDYTDDESVLALVAALQRHINRN